MRTLGLVLRCQNRRRGVAILVLTRASGLLAVGGDPLPVKYMEIGTLVYLALPNMSFGQSVPRCPSAPLHRLCAPGHE